MREIFLFIITRSYYLVDLQKELDVTLGFLNTDLEGRFVKVRTEETNLGIF